MEVVPGKGVSLVSRHNKVFNTRDFQTGAEESRRKTKVTDQHESGPSLSGPHLIVIMQEQIQGGVVLYVIGDSPMKGS